MKTISKQLENGKIEIKPYLEAGEKRGEIHYDGGQYLEEDIKLSKRSISGFINTLDDSGMESRDNIESEMIKILGQAQEHLEQELKQLKQLKQESGSKTKVKPEKYLNANKENRREGRLTGRINDTFYLTAWFREEGSYQPMIITSDKEIHEVRHRLTEIRQELVGTGEELSEKEMMKYNYYYVKIGDTKLDFGEEFPEKPQGINYIDAGVLNYLYASNETELDLTEKNGEINPHKLYNSIRGYFKKVFDHTEEEWYDILASYTIHTYLFEEMGYTIYLVFTGKPDTGKTQAQEALAKLNYNGKFTGNATPTATTRLAHTYQSSLHQDEIDKMSDERRKQLVELYNTGYRKGGSYTQTDMNKSKISEQIREITSFCPKTLSANFFSGNWAESLKTRCIRIETIRTNRDDIRDTLDFRHQEEKELQEMRNAIAAYCLNNWKGITDSIEKVEKNMAHNRENQKYALFQGIMNHFGNPPKNLMSFLKEEDELDPSSNELAKSEEILVKHITEDIDEETKIIYYKLKELAGLLEDKTKNREYSSKSVKKLLRRLGLLRKDSQISRSSKNGLTEVSIPVEIIEDSLERYGIKSQFLEESNSSEKIYNINFPING